MKSVISAVILAMSGSVFGELSVPQNAQIFTPIVVSLPVTIKRVDVAELRCLLPVGTNNPATRYIISLVLTDTNDIPHNKTIRLTQAQAEQMSAASEASLSNIVAEASSAIQALVNHALGGTP